MTDTPESVRERAMGNDDAARLRKLLIELEHWYNGDHDNYAEFRLTRNEQGLLLQALAAPAAQSVPPAALANNDAVRRRCIACGEGWATRCEDDVCDRCRPIAAPSPAHPFGCVECEQALGECNEELREMRERWLSVLFGPAEPSGGPSMMPAEQAPSPAAQEPDAYVAQTWTDDERTALRAAVGTRLDNSDSWGHILIGDAFKAGQAFAQRAAPPRPEGAVEREPVHWHELKTDPAVFGAVHDGSKTFEIRKDDRGFAVGDGLLLRETVDTGEAMKQGAPLLFTGREYRCRVTYILRGPIYGLVDGWAILSIAALARQEGDKS